MPYVRKAVFIQKSQPLSIYVEISQDNLALRGPKHDLKRVLRLLGVLAEGGSTMFAGRGFACTQDFLAFLLFSKFFVFCVPLCHTRILWHVFFPEQRREGGGECKIGPPPWRTPE